MKEGSPSNLNYNICYWLFLPALFYYSLVSTNDLTSSWFLFLSLLSLTSVFTPLRHKRLHLLLAVSVSIDLIMKILMATGVIRRVDEAYINMKVIDNFSNLGSEPIQLASLIYLLVLVLSWFLVATFNIRTKSKIQTFEQFKLFEFLSTTLNYITPVLLYVLCYTKVTNNSSFRDWLEHLSPQLSQIQLGQVQMFEQVGWSLLTALCLTTGRENANLRRLMTAGSIVLLIRDHHVQARDSEAVLYLLKWKVVCALKIGLLTCWRTHNLYSRYVQKLEEYQESAQREAESRMSSHMRFVNRKKLSEMQSLNYYMVLLLLSLTVIAVVLTNGLGNVIIILAIGMNCPVYEQKKFRKLVATGAIISIMLQPSQFIYFVFLYLIRLIKTHDEEYARKNWWLVMQFGRIVILLSKVSLLTFLIGLFQSQKLVLLTLIFRVVCSYYGEIIVFMGTEDAYSYYLYELIPKSIIIDIILWIYLLLRKIYSPSSSVKFGNTDIVNIFEEYALVNYFEKGLKVLKVFHWIAYISISFFILNNSPSLFTLLRILPLVLVFIVGILDHHRSKLAYNLWHWNLYTAIAIAFIKYFYLLSRYSNLSSWLVRILQPLIAHHKFIGLTPPDNTSLLVSFGPDFLIIIVNAIMVYVIRVQLSELAYLDAKKRIYQQQGLSEQLVPEKEEQTQTKTIHYLYKQYVQPLDIRFKEKSILRVILTDYIMDLCFLFFLIVVGVFRGDQSKAYYVPHFALFFYGFWRQKGKHYPKHLFNLLVFICSLDLLFIYIRYFFSMIVGSQVSYNVTTVISKYCLVMITVIFKQISVSLEYFYQDISHAHRQHNFLLFQVLTPAIESATFRREVIVLYYQWNRIFAYASFIAVLIVNESIVREIHFWVFLLLLAGIVLSREERREIYKRHWMYFLLAGTLIDLWLGYLSAIFCLIALRGSYMFLEEFDLQLFVEVYERSNRTDNEETRKKVEEEEDKMRIRFNFPEKNRLQIIEQAGPLRQQSSSEKNNFSVNWSYKNTYTTIVWLLPLMCMFVIALGALFYDAGYYAVIIFTLCFLSIVLSLRNIFNFTVKMQSVKWLMICCSVVVKISIIDKHVLGITSFSSLNYYGLGLFLLLLGLFGYFQLLKYNDNPIYNMNVHYAYHIDFCQKRSLEAIQYWRSKCQMVSQLGSQIHNEKKISSLKTFFLHRENLSVKVQQLENQLKFRSSHRRTKFRNLEKLEHEAEEELKKVDFEVFSNMLTFMSFEDLEFCYLDLNQFFNGQVKEQNDLPRAIRNVREWVIRNFEGSIRQTLEKYKNQLQEYNRDLQVIKVLPVIEEDQLELESPMKSTIKQRKNSPIQKELEKVQSQLHQIEEKKEQEDKKQFETPPRLQKESDLLSNDQQKEPFKDHGEQKKQITLKKKQSLLAILKLCESGKKQQEEERESSNRQQFRQIIDQRLNEHNWLSRKLIQNLEIIGLIVTAGWNFFGGVYTIPTNIAIFSWAIVLQTKTTVAFWMFLMIYSFCIVACKLMLTYLPQHFFFNFFFYYHAHDYLYEFLIIFVAAIEIIFLKMGGTSQMAYSQRQNIYDAFYRNLLNQASRGKQQEGEEQFINVYKKMRHSSKHSFFYRVFSKGRLKPGRDFYPLLAIVQVIILFYIFFFYDQMEFESKNNRKSLGQLLTVSQFSKNMILALFFQVMIMIIDRVIVALNIIDRLNQKIQNFFFSFAFKHTPKYKALQVDELSSLGKFDYLLIIKYTFHVTLLLLINFFVYFYIPSGGLEKSIIPQCEMSVCGKSYNYLSFFLLLYLIYFVISGLQIKHGFNRNKCRNTLMESYHWIDYYIYMFFTGMPFLWEFKKISDWTTTATALPLFHWMKYEDINARMYRSKCQAEILKQKQLGKKPWYKPILGPVGFFFIIAVVFSPVFMYSSFNPFAVKDSIVAASSELQLVMNGNIYYTFFQTSHTSIYHHEDLNKKYKLLGFFDRTDLYKLETSSYPDQDFSLSQPAIAQLSDKLFQTAINESSHSFAFSLRVDISQQVGGDSQIVWGSKQLTNDELMDIYLAISSNETDSFTINSFYSPFPGQIANQSIYVYNRNNAQYFQVKTDSMSAPGDPNKSKGIFIFYKSSVKYNVAFGLLTFYLTYVVLINSLFRVYLTGNLETIIFQGPQLQKILFLCEAVRSARILENFYQEQYLYFSLVDLMRHPRMIRDIADDFVNLRTKQHEKKE